MKKIKEISPKIAEEIYEFFDTVPPHEESPFWFPSNVVDEGVYKLLTLVLTIGMILLQLASQIISPVETFLNFLVVSVVRHVIFANAALLAIRYGVIISVTLIKTCRSRQTSLINSIFIGTGSVLAAVSWVYLAGLINTILGRSFFDIYWLFVVCCFITVYGFLGWLIIEAERIVKKNQTKVCRIVRAR